MPSFTVIKNQANFQVLNVPGKFSEIHPRDRDCCLGKTGGRNFKPWSRKNRAAQLEHKMGDSPINQVEGWEIVQSRAPFHKYLPDSDIIIL